MPAVQPPAWSVRHRLALLLAASYLLRLAIVWRGGQFFWPDESRYFVSRAAAAQFRNGGWGAGLKLLFASADHLLFKVIGVFPALIEGAVGSDPRIAAAFFALFSTAVIAWVWLIARRAGGGSSEAWIAAFLTACANCLFYYSRHLVPYDVGLFFLLGGLFFGLRPGGRSAFAAGVWVSLGFASYNGYWQLGGAILTVVTLTGYSAREVFIRRAACALAGLVLPLAVFSALAWALGANLISSYIEFSRTANIGNLDFGWRFVGEYLWAADRGLALLWAAAFAVGIVWVIRGRGSFRLRGWIAIAGLTYVAMVAGSDAAHRIVIHARTVRGEAPFLCLLTAAIVCELRTFQARLWLRSALLVAAAIQATANFGAPLAQIFPREFVALGQAVEQRLPPLVRGSARIRNAIYLSSASQVAPPPLPGHEVLLRRPHPLNFNPYLYEGFIRAERARFELCDLSMRVEYLRPPAAIGRLDGYSGPLRITLRLPLAFKGREPVVATGRRGAGDLVYLIPEGPKRIRIGFDHWSAGGPVSGPITVEPGSPLELVVSTGALYPPLERFSGLRLDPRLKGSLLVEVNGAVALSGTQGCWPSEPGELTAGENAAGFSTAGDLFSGEVLGIDVLPLSDAIFGCFRSRTPQAAPAPVPSIRGNGP